MPARVRTQWNGDLIKARVQRAEEATVTILGERLVVFMQSIVPVDTGALKGSLDARTQKLGNGWMVTFGSFGIHYAIYVELGTYKMRAQPYVRPAADWISSQVGGVLRSQMA
ncbi:MAG: hypothetical protein M3440_06965 [Chloroflexota bacterium]|nr:hypothetical protein [Chloroflexota bacterium]